MVSCLECGVSDLYVLALVIATPSSLVSVKYTIVYLSGVGLPRYAGRCAGSTTDGRPGRRVCVPRRRGTAVRAPTSSYSTSSSWQVTSHHFIYPAVHDTNAVCTI